MTIFDELFLKQSVHVHSLPPHSDMAARGKLVGDSVTAIIDILRNPSLTPCRRVNALAALQWDLIGSLMVPTALADVPQVHFGAHVSNDEKAVILCPMDFYESIKKDFIFCAGAMVFVGSQARDWYNDKLAWIDDEGVHDGREEVANRARAYEAEWLLFIQSLDIGYEFNEYQQKIVEDSPEGLDSHPELIYDSKFFIAGKPTIERPPEPHDPWQED